MDENLKELPGKYLLDRYASAAVILSRLQVTRQKFNDEHQVFLAPSVAETELESEKWKYRTELLRRMLTI